VAGLVPATVNIFGLCSRKPGVAKTSPVTTPGWPSRIMLRSIWAASRACCGLFSASRATWARDRACSAVPVGRYRRGPVSASGKKSEQRRTGPVSHGLGSPSSLSIISESSPSRCLVGRSSVRVRPILKGVTLNIRQIRLPVPIQDRSNPWHIRCCGCFGVKNLPPAPGLTKSLPFPSIDAVSPSLATTSERATRSS